MSNPIQSVRHTVNNANYYNSKQRPWGTKNISNNTSITVVSANGISYYPPVNSNISTWPTTTPPKTGYVYIDVDNMTSDINLETYLPTFDIGTHVRVRKIDTSSYAIRYNDGIIQYTFIQLPGEYITMQWDGTKFLV